MKTGLYNIFLRGLTLVSKFAFIVFLGKYSLDEVNLGIFGIIATSVALLIYVIGFDFYTFNTREIISGDKNYTPKIINQLAFHLAAYVLIIPLFTIVIFRMDFIPNNYFWIFPILLISEHLGQELYRLLTTLEKSPIANLMLFMRSGLWIWYALFDFFVLGNSVNLERYIFLWAVFSWSSFFLFGIWFAKGLKRSEVRFSILDWDWIKLGLKTSSVFFFGSLSFQVIQFSDRYMIDFFYGKKMVGIYTAYAQFTNAIEVFTFSAITMVAYPRLVKTFTSDLNEYKEVKFKFTIQLVTVTLGIIGAVLLVAPFIFDFLDKKAIVSEISTFHILLAGVFMLILSNIYHYDLYVKKKDTTILKTAIVAMVVNVLLNLILIPKFHIYGAAWATLISFAILFVTKLYFSRKNKYDSIRFD